MIEYFGINSVAGDIEMRIAYHDKKGQIYELGDAVPPIQYDEGREQGGVKGRLGL